MERRRVLISRVLGWLLLQDAPVAIIITIKDHSRSVAVGAAFLLVVIIIGIVRSHQPQLAQTVDIPGKANKRLRNAIVPAQKYINRNHPITVALILEETAKVPAVPGHIHQVNPPITNAQKTIQHVRQQTVHTRMPMRPTTMRLKRRDGLKEKNNARIRI